MSALLLWLTAWSGLSGCAMNFAELRPARTLEGGEVQIVYGNNVVVPTSGARQAIGSAVDLAEALGEESALEDDQVASLAGGAAAIALSGPGYGTYLEGAVGLGYGFDASARVGSGIQALGVRRGLDRHPWHANAGLRVARNTGGAWSTALGALNTFVQVGELRRTDLAATLQGGVELGEFGALWGGAKGLYSPYRLSIDARDFGADTFQGDLRYLGGFMGGAAGFRFVHLSAELMVLRAAGDLTLFDANYDLGGWVVAPSWGVQATF